MSRKTKITTLFVAVATAAVFTTSASGMARMDNGAYGNGGVAGEAALDTSNIPYLSHGVGITREAPQASQGFGITRIAPALSQPSVEIPYLSHGVGITREAPTQATPILRDKADGATLQRGYTAEVSLVSSSSVDWSEVATGFGFGLLLAAFGAVSLLMLRQRTLRTQ
jgi:hypothetical protein